MTQQEAMKNMTLVLTDIDKEAGIKWDYYKQDNGNYAYIRYEYFKEIGWKQVCPMAIDWDKETLEWEHEIKLPA